MPEWIGQIIGKVRVDKYLARGGMAEVYLGTHLSLDRQVAIKVLHSFIESDPELLDRFQREAKAVAGLRHPNIVQVFDFDTYEGHPYIVMEYLKGPALSTYLQALHKNELKLSLEQTGKLLKSLVAGMDYAHAQGIVHRDIKPANILLHNKSGDFTENSLLTKHVEPVITDFGLARIAHSGQQTASGLVSGTPAYMSPEQANGSKVDHRTDIYSLGVILYELIAGRVPFEGDTAITVIFKHINEAPPPIDGISQELQAVIDKALTKNPEDRYDNGYDLMLDYYQATGIHLDSETTHSSQSRTPRSVTVSKKKNPILNPLLIGTGIFACACMSFLLLSLFGISIFSLVPQLRTTQVNLAPTAMVMDNSATTPVMGSMNNTANHSVGVLRFQDGTSALDKITISAELATPTDGTQYEAWLVGDTNELRKSLGVLTLDSSGRYVLSYLDPKSRNLLDGFSHLEITIEPNPDSSPNPSNNVAYSSAIPAGSLMHIRHLLVRFDATPNNIGMTVGLVDTSKLIKTAADAMLSAFESGDAKSIRSNAEAIINLIVGKQDPINYKDWDGNGKINDPGDGYGLLLNGDQAGYVGGTIDHAELSASAPDSTSDIRMHSQHVVISATNVEGWATQLRDIAMRIVQAQSDQNVETDVRSVSPLANQILNGIDINGNEVIDPIPGEGGAITAYQHADYMSDMPILPGKGQTPPTGE